MSIDLFKTIQAIDLPTPKGILQVGASFGQEFKHFVENGVTHGVFVEPLTEPFNHVAGICKQRPGFVAVNALCSDVSGQKHTFHVASNGGMSSSILAPRDHLQVFDYVKFEQTTELISTTVDDIITFLNSNGHQEVTRRLDTLYMDVQGAEFKVLLGAGRTLASVDYIFTELIRGNLYDGMLPLPSYIALLDAQGFTLNNINYNAQHHADALFVRKSLVGLK